MKRHSHAARVMPVLGMSALLLLCGCAGPQTSAQREAEAAERESYERIGAFVNGVARACESDGTAPSDAAVTEELLRASGMTEEEIAQVMAQYPVEEQSDPSVLTEAEQSAKAFADALIKEDYEAAFSMLSIKDRTFVSAEDLKNYIPRTDFAVLTGTGEALSSHSHSGSRTDSHVTLKYGPDAVRVHVVMDESNRYKIDFEEFIVKNWKIQIPKNALVTLNGIDASGYVTEKREHCAYAVIPAIAKLSCQVQIETDFGTFTKDVMPLADEEPTDLVQMCEITDEDFRGEVYAAVKDMLNQMQGAYEAGESASAFGTFLDASLDMDAAKLLYDKINAAYKWNYPKENMYFSYVGSGQTGDFETGIVPVEKDVLRVSFCATKAWECTYGAEQQNLYGQIYVTWQDGETKWADPGDCDFLGESNRLTNYW